MNASFAMARASSGEAVASAAVPCACASGTQLIAMPRPSAIAPIRFEIFIRSPFPCGGMALLAERHVQAGENRELRYAPARMGDRVLRFDERVVDRRAAFPRLAGAEAHGDVVAAVLQIEGPGAGGPDVPAVGQVEDAERLRRQRLRGGTAALSGERVLPLHQRAEQPCLRRADGHGGESGLPLAGAEARIGGGWPRQKRTDADLPSPWPSRKMSNRVMSPRPAL